MGEIKMPGLPKLTKSEIRFREGLGEKYQRDRITIRCQAVSKNSLRKLRIERGDLELTSDEVWPEGQCVRSAEPGTYLCKYHGGSTVAIEKRGNYAMMGALPVDMQEKIKILQQNPDYINREMQIWEVLAMNAQLYERMDEEAGGGGPDTFERILDGLQMIEGGNIPAGITGIRKAVLSEKGQRELRDEIRINMNLLKELTKVQVSTAKELKTMATTDQVMALVEGVVDDFITIVKDVVGDKTIADRLIDRFVRAVRLRLNARIVNTPDVTEVVDGSVNPE